MRFRFQIAATLGALAVMASPAFAQRGQFGGGGMGGPGLLLNKGVQQEIKLSDEQAEKAQSAIQSAREKYRDQFQGLQDLQGRERFEKMQQISQSMNAEVNKELKGILKPEQYTRYEQIALQQRGPGAFADEAVAKKLNLTDDQKTKFRELMEAQSQEMRDAFQGGNRDDREAMMKRIGEIRKQSMEKANNILTSEQKTTWKGMIGSPYEVKFEPGGGRNR